MHKGLADLMTTKIN